MSKEEFSRQVLSAEGSLYRVSKTLLRRDADCADAIQSGILKAWRKLDTLRSEQYFKTWLTRIVINECYQTLRGARRLVPLEDCPGRDERTAQEEQGESEMLLALAQMDEKYRVPIELHEIEGYSAREIGDMLGLTETNVRNRLFRGKKELARQLKEGGR